MKRDILNIWYGRGMYGHKILRWASPKGLSFYLAGTEMQHLNVSRECKYKTNDPDLEFAQKKIENKTSLA